MKSVEQIQNRNRLLGKVMKTCLFVGVFAGLFGISAAYAAPGGGSDGVAMSAISTNVQHTVSDLAIVLNAVALIAGIGFVMASFFKFHQHKLNPTQVPLSQGLTLLMIGAGLILFPVILPTAKRSVFGSTATISTVTGSAINGLIGGNGGGKG